MRVLEFGRSVGSSVFKRLGRVASRFQEGSGLAADVLEGDDEFLVVFDAPGASAADVQVSYRDGAVAVQLDRFREYREGFEMLFPGRGLALDGRAKLPDDAAVDADGARATLDETGTLSVFVPKVEGAGTDVAVTEATEGTTVEPVSSSEESSQTGDESH